MVEQQLLNGIEISVTVMVSYRERYCYGNVCFVCVGCMYVQLVLSGIDLRSEKTKVRQ